MDDATLESEFGHWKRGGVCDTWAQLFCHVLSIIRKVRTSDQCYMTLGSGFVETRTTPSI